MDHGFPNDSRFCFCTNSAWSVAKRAAGHRFTSAFQRAKLIKSSTTCRGLISLLPPTNLWFFDVFCAPLEPQISGGFSFSFSLEISGLKQVLVTHGKHCTFLYLGDGYHWISIYLLINYFILVVSTIYKECRALKCVCGHISVCVCSHEFGAALVDKKLLEGRFEA